MSLLLRSLHKKKSFDLGQVTCAKSQCQHVLNSTIFRFLCYVIVANTRKDPERGWTIPKADTLSLIRIQFLLCLIPNATTDVLLATSISKASLYPFIGAMQKGSHLGLLWTAALACAGSVEAQTYTSSSSYTYSSGYWIALFVVIAVILLSECARAHLKRGVPDSG
jgi:hypothetical protein